VQSEKIQNSPTDQYTEHNLVVIEKICNYSKAHILSQI